MSRSRTQRDKSMSTFTMSDPVAGHETTRIGNDFNKGRRGMARSVKGAKKRLHTVARARVREFLDTVSYDEVE